MQNRVTNFICATIAVALWGLLLHPLFTSQSVQAEGYNVPQWPSPQVQVLGTIDKKILLTYVGRTPHGLPRIMLVIGLDSNNKIVVYDKQPY